MTDIAKTLTLWFSAQGGINAEKIAGLSSADLQNLFVLFTNGDFVDLYNEISRLISQDQNNNQQSQDEFEKVVATIDNVANYLVAIINDIDDLVLVLSALLVVALKGIPLTLMYKAGILFLNYV